MRFDDGVLDVEVEGASEEQLRKAAAAARAEFDKAGADPWAAAGALFKVEGLDMAGRLVPDEGEDYEGGAPAQEEPGDMTAEDWRLVQAWGDAERAAAAAAGLRPGRLALSIAPAEFTRRTGQEYPY
jgi:hypothetical protein